MLSIVHPISFRSSFDSSPTLKPGESCTKLCEYDHIVVGYEGGERYYLDFLGL